ncbi:MAG: response regulator transcription factor [Burkholderiaceae bacterium]
MRKAALLVEDRDTQLVVRTALECAGLQCESYPTTVALLRALKRGEHRIVVVDFDRAQGDCASLRDWRDNWLNPDMSLIAIGSDGPWAASRAFEAGVDDFVVKPVRGAELIARMNAAERTRRRESSAAGFALSGCSVDRAASTLVCGASKVALTGRELAVAQLMFEHLGRLVTRERIAHDVWGAPEEVVARSIEQHVYQLRRKLKRCAGDAVALRSVYGRGYRLEIASTGAGSPAEAAGQVPVAPAASVAAPEPSGAIFDAATAMDLRAMPPSASRPAPRPLAARAA